MSCPPTTQSKRPPKRGIDDLDETLVIPTAEPSSSNSNSKAKWSEESPHALILQLKRQKLKALATIGKYQNVVAVLDVLIAKKELEIDENQNICANLNNFDAMFNDIMSLDLAKECSDTILNMKLFSEPEKPKNKRIRPSRSKKAKLERKEQEVKNEQEIKNKLIVPAPATVTSTVTSQTIEKPSTSYEKSTQMKPSNEKSAKTSEKKDDKSKNNHKNDKKSEKDTKKDRHSKSKSTNDKEVKKSTKESPICKIIEVISENQSPSANRKDLTYQSSQTQVNRTEHVNIQEIINTPKHQPNNNAILVLSSPEMKREPGLNASHYLSPKNSSTAKTSTPNKVMNPQIDDDQSYNKWLKKAQGLLMTP